MFSKCEDDWSDYYVTEIYLPQISSSSKIIEFKQSDEGENDKFTKLDSPVKQSAFCTANHVERLLEIGLLLCKNEFDQWKIKFENQNFTELR